MLYCIKLLGKNIASKGYWVSQDRQKNNKFPQTNEDMAATDVLVYRRSVMSRLISGPMRGGRPSSLCKVGFSRPQALSLRRREAKPC